MHLYINCKFLQPIRFSDSGWNTYIRCVFFHIMIVTMVTGRPSPPEAVLAQLVVIATLTFVPKSHEGLSVAPLTLYRMEHCQTHIHN